MKKKTLTFFASISFFPFLSGCSLFEPDDAWLKPIPPSNTLPPITQTGANTFGCKVNGQVWLPSTPAWVDYTSSKLTMQAISTIRPASNVTIVLYKTVKSTGVFQIGSLTSEITECSFRNGSVFFYTDTINNGQINISRLDTINSIISGTFWFDARNKTTGEVVHVTEGRFDNKYN